MPLFRRGGGSERSGGQPGDEVARSLGALPEKTGVDLVKVQRANAAGAYAGMPQVDEALRDLIRGQFKNDPDAVEDVYTQTMKIRVAKAEKAAGVNGTQG